MKQVTARVTANSEIMPGVYLTWLESSEIADEAKPGQFIMVRCGGDTVLPRPFSIHRLDGDSIALLINIVGQGTEWLSQRRQEDMVELFGPLGNGFTVEPGSQNLLLVAGGMGIAPLVFLAEDALSSGHNVRLLYGTANKDRYSISTNIESIAITEDGSVGKRGLVTDFIAEHINWADQVFACGPMPMYRNLAENFPQLKYKPVQVSLEVTMGCGRGICYGCTIKTKQGLKLVCQDGPVFDLEDILWGEINANNP